MNNKITILIPNGSDGQVANLDELIDKTKFNIMKIGQLSIGSGFNFNFDIIYDRNDLCCDFMPHFGKSRLDKSLQLFLFERFKLNYPKSFKIHSSYYLSYYSYLKDYRDDDKFIIKYELGARGIGQVLLTKKEFETFIKESKDNVTVYEKNKKDDYEDKIENEKIKKFEISNKFNYGGDKTDSLYDSENLVKECHNCFIQEFKEIKNEYRLLMFWKEKPILIKRAKAENGWQSNSCQSGIGEVYDIDLLLKSKEFKNFYSKVEKLFYYWNSPAVSFDIYEDSNFDYGCLEFSTEFGYEFVPKEELFIKFNNALENIIKEKLEEFSYE